LFGFLPDLYFLLPAPLALVLIFLKLPYLKINKYVFYFFYPLHFLFLRFIFIYLK
jgi:hypothetical protein